MAVISQAELEKMHEQLDNFLRQIRMNAPIPKSHTIIYCQATYDQDYLLTQKCVERVSPHVDYTIIVEDGSLTDKQKEWLRQHGCIVKTVAFKDNLPEYRNAYLEEAKKIDPYAWVLVSDPDELFSESLVKDIRLIVSELEKNGYNMAGINCRECFENVEWLDSLDLLKETPGGYRESDFWKNLLFKLTPRLCYKGVGKSKTVHETWYSPDMPWFPVNLPKKYWYEHRKSALKIWRNAARNVFMGGGGDNLGDLIPQWRELRWICHDLGITSWRQYEEYLKKGNINPKLKDFLIKCLTLPATKWGTEYREMAKWYFAMHKDELTPEILEKIKNPPPMPKQSEIETYVTKCYFQILGRHPDGEGLKFYTEQILKGRMNREHLPIVLFSSDEYKRKFLLSRKDDIALCIMGYSKALPMILESVQVTRPYVDEIHIQGDDFTEDDIKTLEKLGCQIHIEPWRDHFSDYKNKCISHAKTKWVLILDHDEIPTPELAQNLRRLVQESDRGTRYNIVAFDSINQTVNSKGEVISENRSHSGKPLLHLNVPNPYYGNPHIWLKPNYYPWVGRRVAYAYRHVKEEGVDQVRAIRNVFLGGGGDNVREANPLWIELRKLTDELGIKTYKQFIEYLQKGNVDKRLKEWFEKAHAFPWHDNELKAFKEYYYKLHPEEK